MRGTYETRKNIFIAEEFFFAVIFAITLSISNSMALDPPPPLELWLTAASERVLRADIPPFNQNNSVHIKAARNEWEDFQVFLRCSQEITCVSLLPGNLYGPSGAVISPDNMELYRIHQTYVEKCSTCIPEQFKPGFYPDALIPFNNPVTKESLYNLNVPYRAVPATLPVDQTHGFLVDVYVPKGAPAGEYTGTFAITYINGTTLREFEVKLTVWDFGLPDLKSFVNVLESNFRGFNVDYSYRQLAYLKEQPVDWNEATRQILKLKVDHGISSTVPGYTISFPLDVFTGKFPTDLRNNIILIKQMVQDYPGRAIEVPMGYLAPPIFTPENPPQLPPSIQFVMWGRHNIEQSIAEYFETRRPDAVFFTEDAKTRLTNYLRCWDDMIDSVVKQEPKAKDIVYYVYLADEPWSLNYYRYVQKVGGAIKQANFKYIKVMVTESPRNRFPNANPTASLVNAVDVWCPDYGGAFGSVYEIGEAHKRGEKVWVYPPQVQESSHPILVMHKPLINYRTPGWIIWNFNLDGFFLWHMGYFCDHENWETLTFNIWDWPPANGGGHMVYPAFKSTVGFDGIVPSLRMKAYRDGVEDNEYFTI